MAKLLLLIDDYLPDSTRVAAKMMHELAIELKGQGHSVYVATPSHRIPTTQTYDLDGITVWQFKSGNVKATSKIKRAINESLLSLYAWRTLKKNFLKTEFDGVACYSPSIFWGPLVRKLKYEYGCPTYLILRDFFPQWAVDAGMIEPGSLIDRYFRFFENLLYRSVSKIGVMSEENLSIFRKTTKDRYASEVLRNWACLKPAAADNSNDYRSNLGLDDKIIFLYGGNIGHAQDMPVLMRLARALKSNKHAHFLFVGQGDQVELICMLAKQWSLDNFTYLPSISQSEFKDLLAQVDVGLFSLSSQHTTHNFPGKLLGYMVNSIPILGCVNKGNDLKPIVVSNNAGYIFDNGEDEALFQSALQLIDNESLRKSMGKSARMLLEKEFSVKSAAQKIIDSLDVN